MKTIAACMILALCMVAVAAETPSGDPANGKRLFMTYGCYECHGTLGAGGGIAGPRIAPNPLPFLGVKTKLRTASGRMPVYSETVLKDGEIADIYAYLAGRPAGKSAHDIDLLNR
jgi:ubiquinol-cytochrome c reductase cytochrome c subunit